MVQYIEKKKRDKIEKIEKIEKGGKRGKRGKRKKRKKGKKTKSGRIPTRSRHPHHQSGPFNYNLPASQQPQPF
jgi:hypothetical protein